MLGAKNVTLEESLEQAIGDKSPTQRAIQAVQDKRRPRLIAEGEVPMGKSLKEDFRAVQAMLHDDQPCCIVLFVHDEALTVMDSKPLDIVMISWSPKSLKPQMKKKWANNSKMLLEALEAPRRVRELVVVEKVELTLEAVLKKAQEFTLPEIDQMGRCLCGAVEFQVKGIMWANILNHDTDSTRTNGISPVHELYVSKSAFNITKGKEDVVEGKGAANIIHRFCGKCGTHLWQAIAEENHCSVFPVTFEMEFGEDGPRVLSEIYQPKAHQNYQNRMFDWSDDLPKFKENITGVRVDNKGEILKGKV